MIIRNECAFFVLLNNVINDDLNIFFSNSLFIDMMFYIVLHCFTTIGIFRIVIILLTTISTIMSYVITLSYYH